MTDAGRAPGDIEVVDRASHVAAVARARLPHLDNLRTVLVGWIIGGHALLGYMAIGGWPYDEVHEVTFTPGVELALTSLLGPTALFVIGTFFFLSGLLAEPAMARKRPARFAADRLVRLGVPFVVFMAVLWPMFMWFAYLAAGHHVSYWHAFTHRRPAEPKAGLVAILGVPASFWLGRHLLRTPSGSIV